MTRIRILGYMKTLNRTTCNWLRYVVCATGIFNRMCGVSRDMEGSANSGDVEYNVDKEMSKRR